MSEEIRRLGRASAIYVAGTILSKLLSVLMLPVYTRYLSPADYGVVELLVATLELVGLVLGLGVAPTLFKLYAEGEGPVEKAGIFSTAILLGIAVSATTALVGLACSPFLSEVVFARSDYATYFRVGWGIYFFQQATTLVPLMYLRAQERARQFVVVTVTKLALQAFLNVWFLVVVGLGVAGILVSTLVAEALVGTALCLTVLRETGLRFSREACAHMVRVGYPFVGAHLAMFVMGSSDRFFLARLTDLATVGVYGLAGKFGFVLGMLAVVPFMRVWEPARFELARRPDAPRTFGRVFLYLDIVLVGLSLALALGAREALAVLATPPFFGARSLVPLVVLAYTIQAWTLFCNIGLYLSEASGRLALAAFLGACVAVALNAVLIPSYGAYGAAVATLAAFATRFGVVYVYAQQAYRIPYDWTRHLELLGWALCAYVLGETLAPVDLRLSAGWKGLVLFGFVGAVYSRVLGAEERGAVRHAFARAAGVARARLPAGALR